MQFRFSTPCAFDNNTLCASFGFSDAANPEEKTARVFQKDVNAEVLFGSLAEVLAKLQGKTADAAIVLFGNCGGENAFIHKAQAQLRCPMVGGAAAIDPQSGKSGLIFGGGEVCVLLLNDKRFTFTAVTENVHTQTEAYHELVFSGRFIDKIDGKDAVLWYSEKREEYKLPETDFEHLTFSDKNGVNAHLSIVDGRLFSGRDLEEKMLLRFAPPECVYEKMRAFYEDEDAIIFGCAGLKGILPQNLAVSSCGLFMFGEVCTTKDGAEFGNLMLCKIRITAR